MSVNIAAGGRPERWRVTTESLRAFFQIRARPSSNGKKTRRRRGPRRDSETILLGKFCYEQLRAEVKRRTICRLVHEQFSRTMTESDITIYARRWAKDNNHTWPV